MLDGPGLDDENHFLGDVRGEVRDALDVLAGQDQSQGPGNGFGPRMRQAQDVLEQRVVQAVHLVVLQADEAGAVRVAFHERGQALGHHVPGDLRHRRDAVHGRHRLRPDQGLGVSRDVDGVVAHALEVVVDLHGRHDEAEVRGQGLLQGQESRRQSSSMSISIRLIDIVHADHFVGQLGLRGA